MAPTKQIHLRIIISGRVQGVGYRAGVRHRARKLGLTGFVQNLDDGQVLIEAEGGEPKIHELLSWCKTGTMLSKVTGITTEGGKMEYYSDFSIRKN